MSIVNLPNLQNNERHSLINITNRNILLRKSIIYAIFGAVLFFVAMSLPQVGSMAIFVYGVAAWMVTRSTRDRCDPQG